MTFSLQILIALVIYAVTAIIILAVSKQKVLTGLIHILSVFFLIGGAFLFFTEYSSFHKREVRNGAIELINWDDLQENQIIKNELVALRHFQEYRNALKGYEFFLLDIVHKGNDPGSYQNTLRDQIISQLENQEYGASYWNKVFDIAFEFEASTEEFEQANYEAVFSIPFGFQSQEEAEDFGDLEIEENYSSFERASQLIYIAQKAQSIDRTSDRVSFFWDQNKVYFYTFFSNARYEQLCEELIDDLILVYEEIVKTPSHKEFYKKYDISDEEFLDFPSKKFTKKFKYSWPFSFWDRRFAEENETEVFRILKEIQTHYKN